MAKYKSDSQALIQKHLFIGWAGLFVFLSLGIVLETLHGFKVNFYLDVRNETRRLMWTLSHTHGTLFSLIHIAFAISLSITKMQYKKLPHFASGHLTGALIAMPLGFFVGGLWTYGGEPGLGIFLVPVGAVMMLIAVGSFIVMIRQCKKYQ